MQRSSVACLVLLALFVGLLVPRPSSSGGDRTDRQHLSDLQAANLVLQQKLRAMQDSMHELQRRHGAQIDDLTQKLAGIDDAVPVRPCKTCRQQLEKCQTRLNDEAAAPTTQSVEKPEAAAATAVGPAGSNNALLVHTRWDWKSIVHDMFLLWPRVEEEQLTAAVASCNNNGTMYCQRMQVIRGTLYLTDYRAIFFDRHYAPARVLPLLETLRRHPQLPDMDLVVAGNDEPRAPAVAGDRYSWSNTCDRWPGSTVGRREGRKGPVMPPATWAATTNRGVMDLPWVDFAWFFPKRPHKLRTPPWSVLHPQLVEAGGKAAWEGKIELAMHTGNVGSPFRKELVKVAAKSPDEMLVNELFIGDHAKIRQTCRELGLDKEGGYQQHKCYMKFEDQCRFKYLLNSASIGYANKFKSLLLCGSVVLYVRDGMRHKEFYEYGLVSGIHYVSVEKASDIPAKVRWLRENDDYARAVAQAGRARMSSLDVGALTDFMAEALTQYAKRQSFRPRKQAGSVRIECPDDLWRHYALSKGWMSAYLEQDNSSCVHPPPPGTKLGPPGWGGSYNGSKPRCLASHDLGRGAQPEACKFDKPFSSSESWTAWGEFPVPHPLDKKREKWMQ